MFATVSTADCGPRFLMPMETCLSQEMFNMFCSATTEQEVLVLERSAPRAEGWC